MAFSSGEFRVRSLQLRKVLRRRLQLQQLEPRHMMSRGSGDWDESDPWHKSEALTVSFAPDGTQIGQYSSSLFSSMSDLQLADWQNAVRDALQAWTENVNVNLGLVADDGSPFGSLAQFQELRFGDIRIGAVPMSHDELAIAIPHRLDIAGSWAGDILFNSEAQFRNTDEVFSAALHELGHVLGLGHSDDPLSAMFPQPPDFARDPSASDIALLQSLYGARGPDLNEFESRNDTIGNATRIRVADEVEDGLPKFDGSTPLINYGEIAAGSDVDVFELRELLGYNGSISVQVKVSELSQLAPKLTVVTRSGRSIATKQSVSGEDVQVTFQPSAGRDYYIVVETPSGQASSFGAYSLVVSYNSQLKVGPERIRQVVRQGASLLAISDNSVNESHLYRMLQENFGLPILDDEQHENDDDSSATALAVADSMGDRKSYHAVESLASATDSDTYRVDSAQFRNPQAMLVVVQSMNPDKLIPKISVTNHDRKTMPVTVLANGLGQYIAQIVGIENRRDYTVRVSSGLESDATFATGNYELSIYFSENIIQPETFVSNTTLADQPIREHTLYVAKSQLFSLALRSSVNGAPSNSQPSGAIWMTIYDSDRNPIHLIAGPVGETRSAASILLQPGEYTVQFGAQMDDPSATVAYQLVGNSLSEPAGVPLPDPTTTPIYVCPDASGSYCYPGPVVSPSPIEFTDPNPTIWFPVPIPIPLPFDLWFWKMKIAATNPVNRLDVNNDSAVSPNDALIVINDLNVNQSRAVPPPPIQGNDLDVNHDRFITPVDVLEIFNYLNATSGGLGEGPALSWIALAVQTVEQDSLAKPPS